MERRNPYRASGASGIPPSGAPIPVEVTRGNSVESRHQVHAVLSDAEGKTLGVWGDGNLGIFPRSSVKMIQAVTFLRHPKLEALSEEEVALACASHHGEAKHVEVVKTWLSRLGLRPELLECGAHEPMHKDSARELARRGERPSVFHNNCSGKHTGILCGCGLYGLDPKGYSNYDHPYQKLQREVYGVFFALDFETIPWGVDGCSLPTYFVPLQSLARAQARLANPNGLDSQIQKAVKLAMNAVRKQPFYLGGGDSLCSQVVEGTGGKAMVKVGAEGVFGASFPELGLGLALKSADGSTRAAELVMANFLTHLQIPYKPAPGSPALEVLLRPQLKNWRGEVVGEIRLARQNY